MAKIAEINEAEWEAWKKGRPAIVLATCERLPPDRLYRMKSTGHRVTILAYGEDGTVRVDVSGAFNRVVFSRQVFGISADDLEECDLPGPDEDVGDTSAEAGYSADDIKDILIPAMREGK